MTQMPDIEIVIPTYNRLPYLRLALNSALAQNYDNFNVTVVDSGSNDGTLEFLKEITSDKLRVVRFEDNLGIVGNWTRAILTAKANLVSIFHDDDILKPDFAEQQVQMFKANPELILCHTGAEVVNSEGDFLFLRISDWPLVTSGSEFTERLLTEDGLVPVPPSVVINRSLLNSSVEFSEEFLSFLDLVEWIKISRQGKIGYIDQPLVEYRIHAAQGQNAVLNGYLEKLAQRVRFRGFMQNELVERCDYTSNQAQSKAWRYFSRAVTSDLVNISANGASTSLKARIFFDFSRSHPRLLLSPRFLFRGALAVIFSKKIAAMKDAVRKNLKKNTTETIK